MDNFVHYDAGMNRIWYAWKDGRGYSTQGYPPYNPGNRTGSAVGDETAVCRIEEYIVREGNQAMPFSYDNDKQGSLNYSEAMNTEKLQLF